MPIDKNGELWNGWADNNAYPLPKRKYATFVLYNPAPTKRTVKDERGNVVTKNAVPIQFSVPAVCTRIIPQGMANAGAKEEIRFYNHVMVNNLGAGQAKSYDSEYITFDDGKIEVELATQRDLYWYLCHCSFNVNGENPTGAPMFMQEDKKVVAKGQNQAAAARFNAEKAVRELMAQNNRPALISLYGSLGFSDAIELQENEEFDIIENTLIEVCHKNPKRILALLTSEDGEANILAYISEAKERGVIISGNGCWYWGAEFKQGKKAKFCLVAEGIDASEALNKFMREAENAPTFAHMKQKVDELRAASNEG